MYTVTWDYPSFTNTTPRFTVTCSSIYDTIHKCEGVRDLSLTFQLEDDALTQDLQFTVQAISEEDIASRQTILDLDAGGGEATSPSTSPSPRRSASPLIPSERKRGRSIEVDDRSSDTETDDSMDDHSTRNYGGEYIGCGYVANGLGGYTDDSDSSESTETESDDGESSNYQPEGKFRKVRFSGVHPNPVSALEVSSLLLYLTSVDSARRRRGNPRRRD
jgi:hypothetical protein